MSRVRTYHSLRRARPGGGVTVFDYLECAEWRGWFAHDFDWSGKYLRVRRCEPEEVRAELEASEPAPESQFSEPKRSQQ